MNVKRLKRYHFVVLKLLSYFIFMIVYNVKIKFDNYTHLRECKEDYRK